MQFHNQNAQLKVYKDGDTVFGELFIAGKPLNKDKTFENIDIKEYEGKTLECVLNGKQLTHEGTTIKTYANVFPPQTILDLKVENGTGTILFSDIPVETIKCSLNLPAYKVNVQNDDNFTIVRYANLHQHTEGSLFDGITKISELANKTEYAGAITDHGNMFGWYEFKNSLEKKGKKPIIGEEFYMESFGGSFPTIEDNDDTEAIMFDKEKTQNEEGLNGEHLIVLAKNNQGIKNLFKLSSEAFLHYHKKPHITFELLKKYKEGLIVCSACIAGGINSFIKEYLKATTDSSVKKWIEDYGEFFYLEAEYQESPHSHAEEVYEYCHKKARESIDWYYENFKDDFYLEYQDHHFPLEKLIMDELVRIRNEEYPQIKIVATCDAHYLNKEDAYVHELWLCNQTKRKIDDPKHMRFVGDGYYVHTSEEMLELFPAEYLDATLEVANKVHYEKEKSEYHLPHFPLPKGFENEVDYLRHVSFEGFKAKFKGTDKYTNPLYRERLKSEFNTIVQMGWPAYFLIVSDFIKWAEDENVRSHWQDYFPDKTLDEIPNELLDKKKIYTGSGRGCVCAGTKVYTKDSLKNIEDIKVGEYVRTHTGELHKVIATHKYPVKEKLIKIDCLFGESVGNAYTADHKIYVIKHEKETNKSRLAQGIKYKTPKGEPEWIPAKDVEIGDYVIQPLFTNDEDAPLEEIDLAKYLNKEDKFYEVKDSTIEWKRPSNVKSPFSTKAIRKETGISYKALKAILEKKKSKKEDEVQKYLDKYDLSIDEWVEYYNNNAYKTTVIPRYLKITEDLMYCLGLLTGDGWTRKNRTEWGVCFNSESNYQDNIQSLEETFSIKMNVPNLSKQAKEVQFSSGCAIYKRLLEDFWESEYNYTAKTKTFPNWVFNISDNLKKAFIKGLWASDGSNKEKTCYDSVSFKLISKIKILLCMLKIPNGLVSRPAHYAENAKGKNCKDSWKIGVPKNFGDNKSVRNVLIKDKYVGKRVNKITEISGEDFVYDITVEKDHSYVTSSFVAHNSGAGSLMNYCLGITKVEPIIYDLKFERFLNPDRISMPDIDTDFEDENRGKVLDYVRFKYGKKKVANIITFNTAAAKNSVKIINRVTCGSVAKGNEIADLIPSEPGMTIEKAMENNDFKTRYESDKEVKNIVDLAKRIEGLKTAQSIHACFTKGTMITTKNGSIPIEEIEVGNEVLTHTGQYKKVLKLSGRSTNETLYEINSSNGFATTCTGDHPYYVISKDDALNLEERCEWVEAKDLIPDKHLLVIPICEKNNKNNKIREVWKIIGMYAYCVTNLHTNKIIGLKENFAKEILDTLKANRCNGSIYRYNNEFSININWKGNKFARDLEMEKIPVELLSESKENIKLFLDGWFYYSKSSFKASNKKFVSDMAHLINIGMELPLNVEERQDEYLCTLAKEYEYHISQKYIYVPFEVSQGKESTTTTVYNLEVEDDHSYVANGKIVHNCATLICDENITNYMPEVLMTDKDTGEKIWVTQMEGPICEELGCLKMDFLGLRTLGYVKEAIASIKKNTGIDIDYDQIPLNDNKVYKYLADGNTPSVFQCESDMFTTVIKKTLQDVKKDPYSVSGDECFERLVAMNALVRPGSNLFIDDFADRIMHPEHITYLVPELKPILKETYGIILYQEQTMRITRDLAGFSAGQADTVRKALGWF